MAAQADERAESARPVRRNGERPASFLESEPRADPEDPVFKEKKQRLLELVTIYSRQGHLTHDELQESLGEPRDDDLPALVQRLERNVGELEAELRYARASEGFLEAESTELESALSKERELVEEGLVRIAHLETQLRVARQTSVKLIAASLESLKALKRARGELGDATFGREALDPLRRDLQEMAQTIQELHVLALVRDAGPPPQRAG